MGVDPAGEVSPWIWKVARQPGPVLLLLVTWRSVTVLARAVCTAGRESPQNLGNTVSRSYV